MVEQEVGLHKRQANRVFRPAKSAVSLVVQSRLGVHPLAARRRYDRMRVVFDGRESVLIDRKSMLRWVGEGSALADNEAEPRNITYRP